MLERFLFLVMKDTQQDNRGQISTKSGFEETDEKIQKTQLKERL